MALLRAFKRAVHWFGRSAAFCGETSVELVVKTAGVVENVLRSWVFWLAVVLAIPMILGAAAVAVTGGETSVLSYYEPIARVCVETMQTAVEAAVGLYTSAVMACVAGKLHADVHGADQVLRDAPLRLPLCQAGIGLFLVGTLLFVSFMVVAIHAAVLAWQARKVLNGVRIVLGSNNVSVVHPHTHEKRDFDPSEVASMVAVYTKQLPVAARKEAESEIKGTMVVDTKEPKRFIGAWIAVNSGSVIGQFTRVQVQTSKGPTDVVVTAVHVLEALKLTFQTGGKVVAVSGKHKAQFPPERLEACAVMRYTQTRTDPAYQHGYDVAVLVLQPKVYSELQMTTASLAYRYYTNPRAVQTTYLVNHDNVYVWKYCVAQMKPLDNARVEHWCSTYPGSSGAGLYVLRDGRYEVVGVHTNSSPSAGCNEGSLLLPLASMFPALRKRMRVARPGFKSLKRAESDPDSISYGDEYETGFSDESDEWSAELRFALEEEDAEGMARARETLLRRGFAIEDIQAYERSVVRLTHGRVFVDEHPMFEERGSREYGRNAETAAPVPTEQMLLIQQLAQEVRVLRAHVQRQQSDQSVEISEVKQEETGSKKQPRAAESAAAAAEPVAEKQEAKPALKAKKPTPSVPASAEPLVSKPDGKLSRTERRKLKAQESETKAVEMALALLKTKGYEVPEHPKGLSRETKL